MRVELGLLYSGKGFDRLVREYIIYYMHTFQAFLHSLIQVYTIIHIYNKK